MIEYLQEENRVLREQIGKRRLRFTDDQRRRLAVKAKVLGRKTLAELDTLAGCGKMRVGKWSFLSGWPMQGCLA